MVKHLDACAHREERRAVLTTGMSETLLLPAATPPFEKVYTRSHPQAAKVEFQERLDHAKVHHFALKIPDLSLLRRPPEHFQQMEEQFRENEDE